MEKKFTVKFRGVRGSYPTPARNFLQYGGNTSCVEVVAGNRLIILDAGRIRLHIDDIILLEIVCR